MARRHLGALFDPNKPISTSYASGDAGAVIANFLGTDKGAARTVYGGCPKGVKDEAEAADKCQYNSTRGTLATKDAIVATRQGPFMVSINPGRINASKVQRGLANAVLSALNAGVRVEDRALISSKSRKIGGAVLATASGGRVLVQGDLSVPVTAEVIRRANAAGTTGMGLEDLDTAAFDQKFIDELVKGKTGSKKRRKSRKSRR